MSRGGLCAGAGGAGFYRAADTAGPVNRGHLDMHTAIRGSLYRQFALLPAHAGDFSPDFYQLLQASGMDAVVRHTEAGGTFTHFTCESSPRKAPPGAGESDAVRR
nr:Succinylglutamate desuccinylase [Klebsiella pneumoniae]